MSFYDMYPMGGMNVGGMNVGGFPVGGMYVGGGGSKESAAKGRAKQIARIIEMSDAGLNPVQIAQQYAERFPVVKRVKMTPEQRAQKRNESIIDRALAIQEGTYVPKQRKPAGAFSQQKSALLKRMRSGRANVDNTAKFDQNALAKISAYLLEMGFGIHDLETGGAWYDDLWSGIKDVASTVAPVLPFIM